MKRYYSRKDKKVGVVYLVIILSVWLIVLFPHLQQEKDPAPYVVLIAISMLVTLFIVDIWMATYYEIASGKLRWHSGHLFHGSIDIAKIRYISHEKTVLTVNGIYKPSLSFQNMTIGYNTYDELLIAPKDEAKFLKHLLEINPLIERPTSLAADSRS